MSELFIPVIQGTSRPKSQSIMVSELIFQVGNEIKEIDTILLKPEDFNLPFDGNDQENIDSEYSKLTSRADGFFIVVPEYNHSFPGTLKRLLDSELQNYNHKAVAFAGVSAGPWGGTRAVESLVNVVRELGLAATHADANFPTVQNLFDEKGNLIDDKYVSRVQKSFRELIWMSKALKWGRENLEK